MPVFSSFPVGQMFPVGSTFPAGEVAELEPEPVRPVPELVCPVLNGRDGDGDGDGELSTESSPEWLLLTVVVVAEPERGPLPVRPESEPDELELVLAAGPVRKGETGEGKLSGRKSGLLSVR